MRHLSVLLFTMTLTISGIAQGSVRRIQGESASVLPPSVTAAAFLQRNASRFGWDVKQLAAVARVPAAKRHIVVFGQNVQGVPVYGHNLKVEMDLQGRVTHVWGEPLKDLAVPAGTPKAPELAVLAAENTLNTLLPLDLDPPLVLLPGRPARLAYLVVAWVGLKKFHVLVDAFTMNVILIDRAWFNAQGRVYGIDPARTPDPIDVELANLTSADSLVGRAGHVWNCVTATDNQGMPDPENMEVEEIPTSDATGNFLYDPVLTLDYTDFAAAVNLYYHVDRMDAHFRALGYTPPVDVTVVANVHSETGGVKTPMDNAYYTPLQNGNDGLFVGQGTNVDLAYGGDVVMHEMTHSVVAHSAIDLGVQQADQYGINRMPLGLHEGLADYFPASLNDSPVIGAYSLEMIQPGASRDLSNNDKVCPDDMVGEEHMDGELIGALNWQVRVALGAEFADEAIFTTLTRLTAASSFRDYAEILVATLEDMETAGDVTTNQIAAVQTVIEAKGLDICGRWVPLDEPRRVTNFGMDTLGQAMGGDCAQLRGMLDYMGVDITTMFQYQVIVPENATSLTLSFDFTPMGGTDLQYNVYGRGGQMVQYELVNVYGGMMLPRIQNYDRAWPANALDPPLSATTAELVWTINDTPPLPTGQEVYFSVTHANCPMTTLDVEATVSTEPIVDPDAGPDGDTDADVDADGSTEKPPAKKDGCSCSAGSSNRPNASFFLLLAVGLFFSLRRRVR
ncbi:hypothetical protein KKD52_07655 [Myxococcota bacterium]|nr:hypothetical protein [Myxococcota bacterium]MBU1413737.1 hypothetical protein [Myxococcota bacterium]MBU1510223.1 hypothetical protein [Myxococcota bacterium]